MTALDTIKQLSATSSRNDKEQILYSAFMSGHREFFVGARLACDPLISFGVAKVPKIDEDDGAAGSLDFNDFLALANRLRKRDLTGHAARDAILAALDRSHVETWNLFYRRILLKDLNVGVETSTINKVLKKLSDAHPEATEYMIPVFMAQMAKDGRDPANEKHLRGKKMLDYKLDGVRLLSVLDKDSNTVTQYVGRNGNLNENFTEVREALAKLMEQLPGSVVLDGEIISEEGFQKLMKQINRDQDSKDTKRTRLALFDIVPLADFKSGFCKTPLRERHNVLSQLQTSGMLSATSGDYVYVVPKVEVDLDAPGGWDEALRITEEAIAAGYEEAVMYKDPEAGYECGKRSKNWLKRKPFIEVSLEVVEIIRGDDDGKYSEFMGRMRCRGIDNAFPGKMIDVKVGGGFTDEQRVDFWTRREELLGMIAEIRADALSLDEDGVTYSLRFPRFKGWRGTKKGEKL
jgi:DNA ligase-1